jgi:hypothetical protein
MKYDKAKVTKRLAFSKTALKSVKNSKELQRLLDRYAYTEDKIEVGIRLSDYAHKMQAEMEIRGKPETPSELTEKLKDCKDDFWSFKQVTTVALKQKHQLIIDLFIDRPIDSTIAGFFRQADHFYNAVIGNTVITKELSRFNVHDHELIKAKIGLDSLIDLYKIHFSDLGDAMQSVRFRDSAMENLDNWMEDFIRIAQVALHKNNDLMELLGFKSSSH